MSIGERIRHELREVGFVTLFFLLWFLLFLTLKKLVLASYQIDIAIVRTALIGALVVAKVVVVLDKTPMSRRFLGHRPIVHVLWRSVSYTLVVFAVTIAERLFHAYRATGGFSAAVDEVWASRDVAHALAMTLAIGLAFVIFNGASVIDRQLGEGGLRRLFFSHATGASTR